MKIDEAKTQVGEFFIRLGEKQSSVFEEKNFAKAMIGDAIMGFVFKAEDETLSCQSLIYRFRKMPQTKIMDAIEEESKTSPKGGGDIAFDDQNLTLVLQKDYQTIVSAEDFYNDMQNLAQTSLIWSNEVLSRVAEKAFAA
jgi:chromosome segregation and condensation protein ScpB